MRYLSLLILSFILSLIATPTYSQTCPTIRLSCPAGEAEAVISVNVSGADPSKLTYKWILSPGKIISGQGTPTLNMDLREAGGLTFTVTVEVGGLPQGCPNTASCSNIYCDVVVSRKFDEYGDLSWEEEKQRLDKLADHLGLLMPQTTTSPRVPRPRAVRHRRAVH